MTADLVLGSAVYRSKVRSTGKVMAKPQRMHRDGKPYDDYPMSDETPHAFGKDPLWQESVFLCWWDATNGIGGFQRIGHEPHFEGGNAFISNFICTRDGDRFRRWGMTPLRPSDHEDDVFRWGDMYEMSFRDGQARWKMHDGACQVDVVIEDFYPATDAWPRNAKTLSSDIAPAHTECAGRIRGQAVLNGRKINIDGLCYRDHSWGKRDWWFMGKHLWIASTLGPDCSFGVIEFEDTKGTRFADSVVVEGDQVRSTKDFSCDYPVDPKTYVLKQGSVTMRYPHKTVEGHFKVIDAAHIIHHGYFLTDYICEIEVGGRSGFFILETGMRYDKDKMPEGTMMTTQSGYSQKSG